MPPVLSPENLRRYQELRRRYTQDHTYRVVTDMYRNLHGEPVVAAHFMAAHDMDKYTIRSRGVSHFAPVRAGYDQAERDFLLNRGVKPL